MAFTEAKTCLFYLFGIMNYSFEVVNRDKVNYQAAIILSVKNGLHCKVSKTK